ncbi:MAG: EAL domain-containing protein [Sulfuricellaceae bacterium]|jgi:diguanylate cyclase (GGDEF)-like protein
MERVGDYRQEAVEEMLSRARDPLPPRDVGWGRKRPLARLDECLPRPAGGGERGAAPESHARLAGRLGEILDYRLLSAFFQPIVALGTGEIHGYAASLRGPSDCPLHVPDNLYALADALGLRFELECVIWQVLVENFARLNLAGALYLRAGRGSHESCDLATVASANGVAPSRVVVELATPSRWQAEHYREKGFRIAVGGLGALMEEPETWQGLNPDFGRIDRHFVQGVHQDPLKRKYLRDIRVLAEETGCRILAMGVESQAGLTALKELGIDLAAGPCIARPSSAPSPVLPAEVAKALESGGDRADMSTPTAERLLVEVAPVEPDTNLEAVYEVFAANPQLAAVPVVKNGMPIGLINRYTLIDRYARPYHRDLYGKRHCTHFMDSSPLVVDKGISIEELSNLVVEAEQRYLSDGFIITDQGRYLGMGTGHALMREVTQLRIRAARYANPLTGLPGNVPINERIDSLLHAGVAFCACYADLNHFKPFNDVYGYNRGDDVIQLTGRLLAGAADPERDFVGHVGGDDFVVLFLSVDWERRCRDVLARFEEEVKAFFNAEDVERGGYIAEDRRGQKIFHPLASLAIAAVHVEPACFHSHREVSAAAAEAKKQAKRTPGNSLFVERRSYGAK